MTPLLEATGLVLPGRLSGTDLRMERPELACLVGPNGSGKTSLLHAIAGVGSPAGWMWVDGLAADGMSPDQRMRLYTYLPATREIAWPITARDLVALGLPSGDAEAAENILGALEIAEFAERRVDRLSTGERSRILIARALAARPKLLLLDEPVSNLDPLWQIRLMDHLQALVRNEGRGVLVALHDLGLAERYADRLIVMDGGRIVADGAPEEILAGRHIPDVFGIERDEPGVWRPVSRREDRRSSP